MKTFAMSNHFYLMDGYDRPQDYNEQAALLRANGIDGYYFNLGRSITEQQIRDCAAACRNEGVELASMYWIADLRENSFDEEVAKFRELLTWTPDGTPIELAYWDMTGELKPSSKEGLDLAMRFTAEVLPDCKSKSCLLSPYPHFIFNLETAQQGLDLIEACGGEGMKPVASAFHSYIAKEDWLPLIEKHPSHFQSVSICGISKPGEVADHSILPLGQGELIDCDQIVQSLKKMGYEGWIGVQAYSVKSDSKDIVANTGKMLREYLAQ